MSYIVIGMLNGKRYQSRKKLTTFEEAVKYGYKLSYNPSGNTKRRKGLYNWKVIKN